MVKNWGSRLFAAIKCSFSVMASLFVLHFVIGFMATIVNWLYQASGMDFLFSIGQFLDHPPMILPFHRDGMTVDIVPLLVVAAAAIWGWTRQPSNPMHKNPLNME